MGKTLAIYDKEPDYANQLMNYIKRKQKKQLQVHVFTNIKSLKEYAVKNTIQLLLMNESLPVEEIIHENIKSICLLGENRYPSENIKYPYIYKYQSAEALLKELFSKFFLTEEQGLAKSYGENIKLISVFTPGEDILRQLFAFSLANQYSFIKKTLYVNFNSLQVLSGLTGYKAEIGLSEFIYYLKQNSPSLLNKMEVIIFDTGSYYQAGLEILRSSRQVLYLLAESDWELMKYENIKEQLNWSGNEEILNKITIVPVSNEIKDKLMNINEDNFDSETGNFSLAAEYIME